MARLNSIKLKMLNSMRHFLSAYLRHYAWPISLLNRRFNYDKYYQAKDILINLGGGPYFRRKGWLNADYLPDHNEDKGKVHLDLSDALDELPFSNVQAYFMSHVLEHFHYEDGCRLLKSIHKSMKDGGILRVVVPDADLVLNRARENDLEYFDPLLPFFKIKNKLDVTCADHALNLLSQPRCFYSNDNANINTKGKEKDFGVRLRKDSNDDIISYLNKHDFDQNDRGSLHLAAYNENNIIEALKDSGFSVCYKSAFMQSKFARMREAPLFDSTHPWLSLYVEAVK